MSLEDKYKSSRSNILPGKYPGGANPKIDRSRLNLDKIKKYSSLSQMLKDTSKFNIDYTPSKYSPK